VRYGRLGPWYRFVVVVARPLLRVTTTADWRRQDLIPKSGGVILAVNHVSYVDPFAIGLYVLEAGRTPKFLAKSSLFEHPLTKRILIGANQIPVYRGTTDAANALSAAVEAVEEGECLLIYPEGSATRDPDCWPMKARTGVARLALETGAPVIPIAQWGPQNLWRYKAKLPRPFPRKKVTILAGPPIDLSAYAGRPIDADLLHEVTDLVMAKITEHLVEIRGGTPPAEAYDPRSSASPGSGTAA
jgi:1-acyl-sn-glycerol-3-phosphate acyltransferase